MAALTIGGTPFLLALLCAATMGLAIQRGGTCTVAAVEELLRSGRPTRLLAMLEASLWVAGGLLLARDFGRLSDLPSGYALTGWTLAGAALLGAGAALNRACVIGTVARLGAGEWAFAATPLGFYAGCASADRLFSPPAPRSLDALSPVLLAPSWLIAVLLGLALLRIVRGLRLRGGPADGPWSPHAATLVIGVAFVLMLVLAGAWTYTDVLADLARAMRRGMAHDVGTRAAIGVALLAGALTGGWMTGQLRPQAPPPLALARCFGGGLLMGWGSLLTPGGNDGLVLIGMPLLWPYAWAAFATMGVVIAAALSAPAVRVPARFRR